MIWSVVQKRTGCQKHLTTYDVQDVSILCTACSGWWREEKDGCGEIYLHIALCVLGVFCEYYQSAQKRGRTTMTRWPRTSRESSDSSPFLVWRRFYFSERVFSFSVQWFNRSSVLFLVPPPFRDGLEAVPRRVRHVFLDLDSIKSFTPRGITRCFFLILLHDGRSKLWKTTMTTTLATCLDGSNSINVTR